MKSIKVSSQGFELNYSVPETVEEYNSLAPKRQNPVLEDAVQNVLYRNVFNKFRDQLVEYIEKVTGVARVNHGTEDEPQWESEGKYMKRVVAEVAKARGLDPAAKATRETLLAEWTPAAQEIINGIAFDPSERESTGTSAPVGKADMRFAEEAVAKGKGQALADLLAAKLGRAVAADVKSLAVAIKDNRRRMADELERQQREALAV